MTQFLYLNKFVHVIQKLFKVRLKTDETQKLRSSPIQRKEKREEEAELSVRLVTGMGRVGRSGVTTLKVSKRGSYCTTLYLSISTTLKIN
jgi:hypothetical protein